MRQVVGLLLAFVVAEPIKVNRVSLLRSANVDSEVADAMRQELTEERSQDGDNVELNEDSRIFENALKPESVAARIERITLQNVPPDGSDARVDDSSAAVSQLAQEDVAQEFGDPGKTTSQQLADDQAADEAAVTEVIKASLPAAHLTPNER
mmetsp:Transcript_23115/g.56184  ORF Transcript_23115/g.56184 Transcript_23115/m.56184 type:complete len:152 (-) Transcript_23115:53-508(-)